MGRSARRIALSEDDDVQLRDLELNAHIHPKVRLRASLLRLHRTGWTVAQLAQHFDRNIQAVHNDLTRFEERGLAGLADGRAPGQPPLVTTAIEQFLVSMAALNWLFTDLGEWGSGLHTPEWTSTPVCPTLCVFQPMRHPIPV